MIKAFYPELFTNIFENSISINAIDIYEMYAFIINASGTSL